MNTQQHITHATIEHDASQAVTITVSPSASDGRWFRVLNWLIDSGAWARLTPSQMALLGVLCRFRGDDGFSAVATDDLVRLSGVGRSQTFVAIRDLITAGLLAKRSVGVWHVMPGHDWARRRQSGPPDFESGPLDSLSLPSPAHRTASPAHRTTPESQRIPVSFSEETETKTAAADSRRESRKDAAAAALSREGFSKGDIERLLATAHPSIVFEAIASCQALAEKGKLRGQRRGYIQGHIRGTWSLFEAVERRAINTLRRKSTGHVTPEIQELVRRRGLGGEVDIVRRRIVDIDEIETFDGMELVGVIRTRLIEGGNP